MWGSIASPKPKTTQQFPFSFPLLHILQKELLEIWGDDCPFSQAAFTSIMTAELFVALPVSDFFTKGDVWGRTSPMTYLTALPAFFRDPLGGPPTLYSGIIGI